MKATIFFYILIACIFVNIPIQSYSESVDYALVGNGYGILGDTVREIMIKLTLKNYDGKMVFQNGQATLGNENYTIKKLDMSFLQNGKLIKINAVTNDDITVKATGKLVTSNKDGSIYQLSGQANNKSSQKLIILATLLLEKTTPQTTTTDKQDILLLVKHYDRVEWKSPYKFVVRAFDPKLNPTSDFSITSGYLEGIKISAKVIDPSGKTLKASDGFTQKYGYYEDTIIIPDNARTGNYALNVTASGKNFNTVTKELTFVVIPSTP